MTVEVIMLPCGIRQRYIHGEQLMPEWVVREEDMQLRRDTALESTVRQPKLQHLPKVVYALTRRDADDRGAEFRQRGGQDQRRALGAG